MTQLEEFDDEDPLKRRDKDEDEWIDPPPPWLRLYV
jgi:hypothetical protein